MIQVIVDLIEAARLIFGSFTGEGYDPPLLPVFFWNPCIDIGAYLRMIADHILGA